MRALSLTILIILLVVIGCELRSDYQKYTEVIANREKAYLNGTTAQEAADAVRFTAIAELIVFAIFVNYVKNIITNEKKYAEDRATIKKTSENARLLRKQGNRSVVPNNRGNRKR